MKAPPSSTNPATCPNRKLAVPFRRASRPMLYKPPGTIDFLYRTQHPGTVPLYSFFNDKSRDYFYSTRKEEKKLGYEPRGVAGFVFPKTMCGASPLYRLFNKKKMHFFTMSASERAIAVRNGYKNEGVVGYMYSKA
jgi:Repeat of unknown function (DUF5648)